jgi:NAD(P)-dependent dehydrogenase (short-subunit alcohol dehydrogenase family)
MSSDVLIASSTLPIRSPATDPTEVAAMIAFVASPDASYVAAARFSAGSGSARDASCSEVEAQR